MKEPWLIMYESVQRLAYEQGLTVSGLGAKAGMQKSVLSDLKSGRKKTLRPTSIKKLCDVLGCDMEDIADGTAEGKDMPERPKRKKPDITYAALQEQILERQEVRRLVRIASKATDKQVHATATLLESVVEGTLGNGGDLLEDETTSC